MPSTPGIEAYKSRSGREARQGARLGACRAPKTLFRGHQASSVSSRPSCARSVWSPSATDPPLPVPVPRRAPVAGPSAHRVRTQPAPARGMCPRRTESAPGSRAVPRWARRGHKRRAWRPDRPGRPRPTGRLRQTARDCASR